MSELLRCIERLRGQLERHRRTGLKEYPTRTIFIDPMLEALGWDVRDPDVVELEYPTIDGRSVDYALKVNRKPVLLLEAKQLNDRLDDLKAVTQVVGYAANDGIEWCVLTNGIRYRVYRASERAAAPEKLLFEVSIDPRESEGMSAEQIADQLSRLSRDALACGVLDELGEEIFTTAKVRKALDRLCADPHGAFLRAIRKALADESISAAQIKSALTRILGTAGTVPAPRPSRRRPSTGARATPEYTEDHHTAGKPQEVVELYRALDRLCQDLAPGQVARKYRAKYIAWAIGTNTFCCAHLQQSGMRVWLKLSPSEIPPMTRFARDVSKVGHWGVGDVELAIDSLKRLRDAEHLIGMSFEKAAQK